MQVHVQLHGRGGFPAHGVHRAGDRVAAEQDPVAPGEFYGKAGARHVRVALTATDDSVDAAVARLAGL